jgi:omega-6 fatty acid desaturase (delta-12 desaturase)
MVEPDVPGFSMLWVAALCVSSSIGFALFHLQHVFNPGYVKSGVDWKFHDAALLGSSWITCVPWWASWATFGIEYHHIHHLNSKIPTYRLRRCHQVRRSAFSVVLCVCFSCPAQ